MLLRRVTGGGWAVVAATLGGASTSGDGDGDGMCSGGWAPWGRRSPAFPAADQTSG